MDWLAEDGCQTDEEEVQRFLAGYEQIFGEGGEVRVLGGLEEDCMVVPLRAKFELWRSWEGADEKEKSVIGRFLGRYGIWAGALWGAFDGQDDKDTVMALVGKALEANSQEGKVWQRILEKPIGWEDRRQEFGATRVPIEIPYKVWMVYGTCLGQAEFAKDWLRQRRRLVRELGVACLAGYGGLPAERVLGAYEMAIGEVPRVYLDHVHLKYKKWERVRAREWIKLDYWRGMGEVARALPETDEYFAQMVRMASVEMVRREGVGQRPPNPMADELYGGNPDMLEPERAEQLTAATKKERTRLERLGQRLARLGLLSREAVVYDYGSGGGNRLLGTLASKLASLHLKIEGFDARLVAHGFLGDREHKRRLEDVAEYWSGFWDRAASPYVDGRMDECGSLGQATKELGKIQQSLLAGKTG